MIVRLKEQTWDKPLKISQVRFNSMIVRLKGDIFKGELSLEKEFQFYDSPIKSELPDGRFMMNRKFQFYDSPIKRFDH